MYRLQHTVYWVPLVADDKEKMQALPEPWWLLRAIIQCSECDVMMMMNLINERSYSRHLQQDHCHWPFFCICSLLLDVQLPINRKMTTMWSCHNNSRHYMLSKHIYLRLLLLVTQLSAKNILFLFKMFLCTCSCVMEKLKTNMEDVEVESRILHYLRF